MQQYDCLCATRLEFSTYPKEKYEYISFIQSAEVMLHSGYIS